LILRIVFWDVLPSVDNYFTQQHIPEDKSELYIRRRENLKSQVLIQLVDIHEIQYGVHAIEGDLDTVIFNSVASTIQILGTFKLLR
jgi:hypothetical protein